MVASAISPKANRSAKAGTWQQRWAVKARPATRELQIGHRVGRNHIDRPGKARRLQRKLDSPNHIGQRNPAHPLAAAA
jgi:hypothetical protein